MALASAFMILAGFPFVALYASSLSILQKETTDAFPGRVFGALGAIQGLSMLVGIGLGALANDRFGVVPVHSAGALMWAVGGIIALARIPSDAGKTSMDAPGTVTV